MSTGKKPAKTASDKALEDCLREIEITKAELEALANKNEDTPEFVISKNNEMLKMMASGLTFKLNHRSGFDALLFELPCQPNQIVDNLQWLMEDMTKEFLPHIHKEQFIEYYNLLLSIKFYFMELLVQEGVRPTHHQAARTAKEAFHGKQ
jgi:hypothetical protein